MSVEAIAYVKSLDLGGKESAAVRLLLYVIAENTFNDTFVCRLTQQQLAYEVRVSDRTVRRHLDDLAEGGAIIRPRKRLRSTQSGQLSGDIIRIRGFKRWYWRDHAVQQRRARAKTPADKMSAGGLGTSGQNVRRPADTCCPLASGQQVSATYKDTRTSKSVPLARDASAARGSDSNFDLEGKAVRDRLRQALGDEIAEAWFADMAFRPGSAGVAIAASPSKVRRDWVRGRYEPHVLQACRAEWPDTQRIDFRLEVRLKGAAA